MGAADGFHKIARLSLALHPRQTDALLTPATETLYGGAVGGGKSHLMRSALITFCTFVPGLQCYLFRRVFEDLRLNHMDGPTGFRAMLAPWAGLVRIVDDEIRFWNGAKIHLCHCAERKHMYKYQGAEMHVLAIDELTHFTEEIYRFLRSRVRATGLTIPAELYRLCPKVSFPRILCGSNPGNIGHGFVRRMFIDGATPLKPRIAPRDEGGMLRVYIPARLADNPSLSDGDPDYAERVAGMGSSELVRAMLEGDWSAIEGAFFDEFRPNVHCFDNFTPPANWVRFRALDWGSASPFSCGWYALSDGTAPFPAGHPFVGQMVPRGALVRYREWYGASKPNVGLKLPVEVVAAGIKQKSGKEEYAYSVADPSMFNSDGGPSKAEKMRRWLPLRRGDNKRTHGWDELRARLRFSLPDGQPPLLYFLTHHDIVRTLPELVHDENDREDVDTDGDDHSADECRYMCMSRPRIKRGKEKAERPAYGSLDWLIEQDELARERERRV